MKFLMAISCSTAMQNLLTKYEQDILRLDLFKKEEGFRVAVEQNLVDNAKQFIQTALLLEKAHQLGIIDAFNEPVFEHVELAEPPKQEESTVELPLTSTNTQYYKTATGIFDLITKSVLYYFNINMTPLPQVSPTLPVSLDPSKNLKLG